MNDIPRPELKLILEGLGLLREKMREEIVAIEVTEEDGFTYNDRGEEYNRLLRLQDRISNAIDSRFY